MRKAIIDSGPLINLIHLGLAPKLSKFFDVVYVPSNVQGEVNRKHRSRYQLRKLYRTKIFQRCRSADFYNVQLLTASLDEGEAEAIAQAQEREAGFVLMDEEQGRKHIASLRNLVGVGTVRILARLHLEGEADDTHKLVTKLRREREFRITDQIVDDAISKAHIPI